MFVASINFLKTIFMKKVVLLTLLIFTFLFFSCDNNDENIEVTGVTKRMSEKVQIEKASLKEQIAYAHRHLLDAGKIISKLYQDDKIKSKIISIIQSRYNKGMESEVFIKDLLDKGVLDSALSKKDRANLDNSLAAFYDLDGQDWHVKIYLPFFEKQIKKTKTMQTDRVYDASKPLVVIEVEDIPDPIGYQESEDTGELEALDTGITEDIAVRVVENGHDLIVISIGDDFDNFAFDALDGNVGSGSTNGSTGGTTNNNGFSYLKLEKMKVKYHKESWAAGGSEINMRGFWDDLVPDGLGGQAGQFWTFHNDDEYGSRIKRFKRRWINRGYTKTLNFKVLWDWNNLDAVDPGKFYDFVIFECDSWPAPIKTETIPHSSFPSYAPNRHIKFRSWQSSYKIDAVYLGPYYSTTEYHDAPNYNVNKNSIKFNFIRTY